MDLESWMTAKGKDDAAVADKIKVTRPYVSRIRRGEVSPSLLIALEIQKMTKGEVELEHLLPRAYRPKVKRPAPTPKTPGNSRKPAEPKASKSTASA